MLRQLTSAEVEQYTVDDPVRPHLSAKFRTTNGRQVWGLFEDQYAVEHVPLDKPRAIICVAFAYDAPRDEHELDIYSNSYANGGPLSANTAVFYTVWSYGQGAGRELVNTLAAHILNTRSEIERWVTLSPLTDMAERFHTNNGAQLRSVHDTCQVFEYTHLMTV
tara:strand:- start:121 stop:612 length:492 start_codon:yes stop_codon:yes gene_type:complete